MLCPYCIEEISDKAIVCKICGRDLQFIAPLTVRISELESQVRSLSDLVESLKSGATTRLETNADASENVSFSQVTYPLLLCTFAVAVLQLILFLSSHGIVLWLASAAASIPPIFLGLWLGARRYSTLLLAASVGVMQTLLSFFSSVAAISFSMARPFLFMKPPAASFLQAYVKVFSEGVQGVAVWKALCFPSLAVFLSSYWLGGTFRVGRRSSNKTSRALAEKVLSHSENESGPAFDLRVKKLATLLAAIAPILTLTGSVIAALFGYLGALQKAK